MTEDQETRVKAFAVFVAAGGLDLEQRLARIEDGLAQNAAWIASLQSLVKQMEEVKRALAWCHAHPCSVNFGSSPLLPGGVQVTIFASKGGAILRLGDGASLPEAVAQARKGEWML